MDSIASPKRVRVVASHITDVYRVAANLRDNDRVEVTAMGVDPVRALRSNYRGAFLRSTAFVDGHIAAMWGMYGDAISDIAHPYLLTTPFVERVPIQIVKEGRKAVAEMLQLRSRLEGHVAASYTGACRLLDLLGFDLMEPEPFGPQGVPFRRFSQDRRT